MTKCLKHFTFEIQKVQGYKINFQNISEFTPEYNTNESHLLSDKEEIKSHFMRKSEEIL